MKGKHWSRGERVFLLCISHFLKAKIFRNTINQDKSNMELHKLGFKIQL